MVLVTFFLAEYKYQTPHPPKKTEIRDEGVILAKDWGVESHHGGKSDWDSWEHRIHSREAEPDAGIQPSPSMMLSWFREVFSLWLLCSENVLTDTPKICLADVLSFPQSSQVVRENCSLLGVMVSFTPHR